MYFDTNLSDKINLDFVESSEFDGFCITKKIELKDVKNKLEWNFSQSDKKFYRKIELSLPNTTCLPLKTIEKYDVYSIKVTNCEGLDKIIDLEPDIITFDFTIQQFFKVKLLRLAIKKNIFIEIPLLDYTRHNNKRCVWLSNVSELIRIVKYRNIVFGSAAETHNDLVKPTVIVDLLIQLGLKQHRAVKVLENSFSLLEACAIKRFCFKNCIINDINESQLKKDFVIDKYF